MPDTPRPQLVIHIGDPKTGTSSIQQTLQDGNVHCDTRRIVPWKTLNAIAVAESLKPKNKDSRAAHFSAVNEWIAAAEADIAVLSSEFFAFIGPKQLQQALRRHVRDHAETAQVLAYVRPHASRYLAGFVQRTKNGGYQGDFASFLSTWEKNDPLQYMQRFGAWRDVFGDRFTLKPFIRSELRGQDIVQDFFAEILKDQAFSVNGTVEANISASLHALAGLRHVQILFTGAGIKRQHCGILGGLISNHYLRQGKMTGEKPKLDRATAEKLRATYLEDAKALDAAFFGRPLMQDELVKSVETAADTPIEIEVAAHYTASEVKRLDELGAAIAKTFLERPMVCIMFARIRRGRKSLSSQEEEKLAANRALVDRFDQGLSELGALLRG